MKLSTAILMTSALALGACGQSQNPEMLRGKNFTATQNGTPIELSFDATDDRVFGHVVNRYNGAYTASGDKIKFDQFISTRMMGLPAAQQVEDGYYKFMATVQNYDLNGDKLTLESADGTKMEFVEKQ
jgi:heat shock protein HslJ